MMAAATAPPVGPIDGRWTLGAGSVAGFRVRQALLGKHADMVGRTQTVSGTITIAQQRLTVATFRIDLTAIMINDQPAAQFATTLDTQRFPGATCTLTQPVTLPSEVTTGATVTTPVTARLTLHGVTRPVTFTVTGRRNGSALQATGSIPISFSDWAIKPQRYGPFGSLADHGVAEFLLILHRQ
jgi:polyisoprenoid-binding protein YceI